MRTVKKSKMYLLIARERESKKFQWIWIQQAKTIFSIQKIPEKLRCTVNISVRVKILSKEKSRIPK
jgi:hypothetical protein